MKKDLKIIFLKTKIGRYENQFWKPVHSILHQRAFAAAGVLHCLFGLGLLTTCFQCSILPLLEFFKCLKKFRIFLRLCCFRQFFLLCVWLWSFYKIFSMLNLALFHCFQIFKSENVAEFFSSKFFCVPAVASLASGAAAVSSGVYIFR